MKQVPRTSVSIRSKNASRRASGTAARRVSAANIRPVAKAVALPGESGDRKDGRTALKPPASSRPAYSAMLEVPRIGEWCRDVPAGDFSAAGIRTLPCPPNSATIDLRFHGPPTHAMTRAGSSTQCSRVRSTASRGVEGEVPASMISKWRGCLSRAARSWRRSDRCRPRHAGVGDPGGEGAVPQPTSRMRSPFRRQGCDRPPCCHTNACRVIQRDVNDPSCSASSVAGRGSASPAGHQLPAREGDLRLPPATGCLGKQSRPGSMASRGSRSP